MHLDNETEGGAALGRALRPDATAVTLKHSLDDRKADTRAFELLLRMHSLEYAEQLVRVAHVEAGAIVAYEIHALRRAGPIGRGCHDAADGHVRLRPLARELERIRQQIDEHLLQQRRVPLAARQLADFDVDHAMRLASLQVGALDYVLKPFKLNVILTVIARALDTRRLRIENAALQRRERSR